MYIYIHSKFLFRYSVHTHILSVNLNFLYASIQDIIYQSQHKIKMQDLLFIKREKTPLKLRKYKTSPFLLQLLSQPVMVFFIFHLMSLSPILRYLWAPADPHRSLGDPPYDSKNSPLAACFLLLALGLTHCALGVSNSTRHCPFPRACCPKGIPVSTPETLVPELVVGEGLTFADSCTKRAVVLPV